MRPGHCQERHRHLAEVTEAISQLGFPPGRVVGIKTRLTPDSMLRIVRIPQTKIRVVFTNENTAHMLKHFLAGYRLDWQIEAITVKEPQRVKYPAQHSDHFVVTHTGADEVTALAARAPDVIVTFQIDEQSVALLNDVATRSAYPGQGGTGWRRPDRPRRRRLRS